MKACHMEAVPFWGEAGHGDAAPHQSPADPGHIGGTGQQDRREHAARQGGQHAHANGGKDGVENPAQHDAGRRHQAARPAARQGVGDDKEHVHPRHDDDAEDENEKDPEVLCVAHELLQIERPADTVCQQAG
jgi:hypothetical protein